MKKLLVVMLVLTFVLAATTAALAGRGRWDNPSGTKNYVDYGDLDGQYTDLDGDGADTGDPHGGYSASSNVCSFCHAVHNAGTNYDGGQVYKLTRSPAGGVLGACSYCHVAGSLVTKKPYDETGITTKRAEHRMTTAASVIPDSTLGSAPIDGGDVGKLDCKDCHNAAPHAMDETYKLTKDIGASSSNLTPICIRCHNKNNVQVFNGKSHILTDSSSTGDNLGVGYQRVTTDAAGITTSCKGCHKNTGGVGLFPHVSEAARFLTTAAEDLNSAGTGGKLDVVCVGCHQFGVDSGVGKTF